MNTRFNFLPALLVGLLCSISTLSYGQRCNPTENWLSTGFPGVNAHCMTEMNGNLYALDSNFGRQEHVLYKYDGTTWLELSAISRGNTFTSISPFKGDLYMAGGTDAFNSEGIMRWDSTTNQWFSVGGGIDAGYISDIKVFQGDLYAAGTFDSIGGVFAKGLAKWDGSRWDSVGNPSLVDSLPFSPEISFRHLHIWNNKLAVGGLFRIPGFDNLALWDGMRWSGFSGSPSTKVYNMTTYNGDLVIYSIQMSRIGTNPMWQVARWDGTSWHSMGMTSIDLVGIGSMLEYQGELYIAGGHSGGIAGGQRFYGVAKWDGVQWHILTGFDGRGYGHELLEYNGRLYLAGDFHSSCGAPIDRVVKLCTNQNCQTISGYAYQDANNNCTPDSGEYPINQQWIQIQPGNLAIATNDSGEYHYLLDTGTYTINAGVFSNYYTSSCPANGYTVTIDTTGGAANLDFGFVPVANTTDLGMTANSGPFRPGFTGRVFLSFSNMGTIPQNGTIEVTLDSAMTTGVSSKPIASQSGQTLSWNYSGLNPSQTERLWLEAHIDTTNRIGDTLCIIANIRSAVGTDPTPTNNVDTLKIVVTGSYDPNDKRVEPAGHGDDGDISFDTESLTYTVRFQNTGTDTAFTVVIRDEIDANLNLGTMSILGSSHAYSFETEGGQKVKWTFDNILLPDSNINEPASHGFVKYRINLKPSLSIGTRIENTASIYFDFNAPIITNTTVTTLASYATSIEPTLQTTPLKVWPNPASDVVNFQLNKAMKQGSLTVMDLQGKVVAMKKNIAEREFGVSVQELLPGMYMYQLVEEGKVLGVGKLIVN